MTHNELIQWDDTFLSTDDKKFYARQTTLTLVYETQHPRTTAIDLQKLLKARRAAKRRSTLHMFSLYFVTAVFGLAIVAGVVLVLWGLCMGAWMAFG